QDTPLGAAGPFAQLYGSCVVSGGIVSVVLGATNPQPVDGDVSRTDVTNGGAPNILLEPLTQAASAVPADLIGEANDNNLGDGVNHTTMTVTSPAHGILDIFEDVSHANNTCSIAVVWTPAS